jgi:hypothetical protein
MDRGTARAERELFAQTPGPEPVHIPCVRGSAPLSVF